MKPGKTREGQRAVASETLMRRACSCVRTCGYAFTRVLTRTNYASTSSQTCRWTAHQVVGIRMWSD